MIYTHEIGKAFWYELDRQTLYDNVFMSTVLAPSQAGRIQTIYHDARVRGTYPAALASVATAQLSSWTKIAKLQRDLFRAHFEDDPSAIQSAFEDFGQGVLIDGHPERVMQQDRVHMMDTGGSPPVGYHRWHASIRTIQTFDKDPWWTVLATLVGLGWAVQSIAQPIQTTEPDGASPNRPIANDVLVELRNAWLDMEPDRLNKQYDLGTGTSGYHPTPRQPPP